MKVLVSGSHGLVGRVLVEALEQRGDTVIRLVRGAAGDNEVHWNPAAGTIDRDDLATMNIDAVVHLAGEPIVGRWTSAKRERIITSRVNGTRAIADAIASLPVKPRAFVCASGAGWYGDRGDRELTEHAPAGEGFLADVVRSWESAADAARDADIRTVHVRFGAVLSPDGGVLQRLMLPFKLCVGGPIGAGRQWMPFIARTDAVRALLFAIDTPHASGALNGSAPVQCTSREFAKAFGHAVHRPAVVPVPPFAIKLVLGRDLATELLLFSQRVVPDRLTQLGFEFAAPDIDRALEIELAR